MSKTITFSDEEIAFLEQAVLMAGRNSFMNSSKVEELSRKLKGNSSGEYYGPYGYGPSQYDR